MGKARDAQVLNKIMKEATEYLEIEEEQDHGIHGRESEYKDGDEYKSRTMTNTYSSQYNKEKTEI